MKDLSMYDNVGNWGDELYLPYMITLVVAISVLFIYSYIRDCNKK